MLVKRNEENGTFSLEDTLSERILRWEVEEPCPTCRELLKSLREDAGHLERTIVRLAKQIVLITSMADTHISPANIIEHALAQTVDTTYNGVDVATIEEMAKEALRDCDAE